MRNENFWEFYNDVAAPKLGVREKTFRKIFEYLDLIAHPISIVETGCLRIGNNWSGDGQSTLLFDKYISHRDKESICYTVDINPASTSECKKLVSDRINVITDDSVHFLNSYSKELIRKNELIDFAYLDSFDVDFQYWYPSAVHHLKELVAIQRVINEKTLVVVDDCPLTSNFTTNDEGHILFMGAPQVGGKGRLVSEYASAVGAKVEFSGYQAGWTGF